MIPLTEWPQFQGEISSGAAYLSNNLFTCSSSFLPRFWYLFFFFFLFHLLSFALSLFYTSLLFLGNIYAYIFTYLYIDILKDISPSLKISRSFNRSLPNALLRCDE